MEMDAQPFGASIEGLKQADAVFDGGPAGLQPVNGVANGTHAVNG